jgi:hypothetical protein
MKTKSHRRFIGGIVIGISALAIAAPAATAYPINPGNGDSYRTEWQAAQKHVKKLKKAKKAKHSAVMRHR